MRNAYKILVGKPKRNHLADLGLSAKKILKVKGKAVLVLK